MPFIFVYQNYSYVNVNRGYFLNTNLTHERIRLLKAEKQLFEMPEDSRDIYKSGINEKYINRPTAGKFSTLRNLCLADFAAMYHKKISCDDNDFQ